MKFCRLCRHCLIADHGRALFCRRRERPDAAGGPNRDTVHCGWERGRVWRWIGLDTCGPDGRYFERMPGPR